MKKFGLYVTYALDVLFVEYAIYDLFDWMKEAVFYRVEPSLFELGECILYFCLLSAFLALQIVLLIKEKNKPTAESFALSFGVIGGCAAVSNQRFDWYVIRWLGDGETGWMEGLRVLMIADAVAFALLAIASALFCSRTLRERRRKTLLGAEIGLSAVSVAITVTLFLIFFLKHIRFLA